MVKFVFCFRYLYTSSGTTTRRYYLRFYNRLQKKEEKVSQFDTHAFYMWENIMYHQFIIIIYHKIINITGHPYTRWGQQGLFCGYSASDIYRLVKLDMKQYSIIYIAIIRVRTWSFHSHPNVEHGPVMEIICLDAQDNLNMLYRDCERFKSWTMY